MGGGPVRVAVVITRLEGGAGILALRGATALDPARFQVTVITGSGTALIARARAAGLEVVVEPSLRAPIGPVADLTALRRLSALLRQRRFDVVHTHTAKAGAVGRLAARRAGAGRIVHTYHGFPFHEFQSPARRGAYVALERRLGRIDAGDSRDADCHQGRLRDRRNGHGPHRLGPGLRAGAPGEAGRFRVSFHA